jgi:hypothetical protein
VVEVGAAVQLPVPLLGARVVEAAALPAQIIIVVMAMAVAVAFHQGGEPGEAVPIVLEMRVVLTKAVPATMEPAIQVELQVPMAAARAATAVAAAAAAGTAEAEEEAITTAAAAPVAAAGATWLRAQQQRKSPGRAPSPATTPILTIPAAELAWAVQAALVPAAQRAARVMW